MVKVSSIVFFLLCEPFVFSTGNKDVIFGENILDYYHDYHAHDGSGNIVPIIVEDKNDQMATENRVVKKLFVDGKEAGKILYFIHSDSCYISWLGVNADHRRKGYGRQLLQSALSDCQDKQFVDLDASNTNWTAIRLYESERFQRKTYCRKFGCLERYRRKKTQD